MDNNSKWIVRGYEFMTEEETKTACLEYSKIKQIEKKIDYKNPQMVYQLYNKAIDGKIFKTVIGYEYLRKLQKYLLDKDAVTIKVKPIPIAGSDKEQETEDVKETSDVKKQVIVQKEKSPFLVYCVVVLVVMLIAMFFISMTGNRPTILNYERTLQNKYAQWEQELQQRENVIKEKERELHISNE